MNNYNNWPRQITLFLGAQTISLLGSSLVQYAIIWYITLRTSSGLMLTISTACGFLPQILISLFAGVWIDRFDRKKIIMLADSLIALATLIVAILFLSDFQSIWLLFAALLIRSAGTGVQTPAVNAFIPQLVPQDQLMKINGINSSITALIMFISPAASGAILSFATIETTFFIDVITALIAVGIMFFIQAHNHKCRQEMPSSSLKSISQGLSYLRDHRFIKQLLIFQIIILILISPSAFLTPLMVTRSFGTEIWRLSLSEMTFSIGAIVGGILIASWGGFKNRIQTAILAAGLYGLLMLGLGLSTSFILYLFFNTLIGITMPIYNSPITVLIQEQVTPKMQGRVFSFMQISTSCALPLGMMLFGPLADLTSVQNLLLFCGLGSIITTIYAWHHRSFQQIQKHKSQRILEHIYEEHNKNRTVKFRKFRWYDITSFSQILTDTWRLGRRQQMSPRSKSVAGLLYVLSILKESEKILVAIKNKPIGFCGYGIGRPKKIYHWLQEIILMTLPKADRELYRTYYNNSTYGDLYASPQNAELTILIIAPQYYGYGLGKQLTDRIEKEVTSLGCSTIFALSDTGCHWHFYEKQGFKKVFEQEENCLNSSDEKDYQYVFQKKL